MAAGQFGLLGQPVTKVVAEEGLIVAERVHVPNQNLEAKTVWGIKQSLRTATTRHAQVRRMLLREYLYENWI